MRKIFLTISLILGGLSFCLLNVEAASNPYSKYSQYGPYNTNCTYFAWQKAYDNTGVALPGWGNANTWLDSAKKAGYETGSTPRANSIAVWKWSSYGHVGYVERVNGNKIYAWDSDKKCIDENYPPFKECMDEAIYIDQSAQEACYAKYSKIIACEYDATYWSVPGDLIGYIYLDNAPRTPISSGTSNQNTGANASTKKSSNANLSNIKISNLDFEFKKDTLEYNLEVKNDIENIKIEATSEDNKAKVEGIGEQKLVVGENTINLKVTAEDGTEKTYTIKIKRKDNNAYLTNLTISNVDFKFDKDTLDYELTISRNIKSITVKGVTESELATIKGLGNYDLLEEETAIKITVIAEDETKKTYTITLKKEPKKFFEKINIWIVMGISTIILTILIFVFIYIIRKRKNKDKKKIKKEKTENSNKKHIDIDRRKKNEKK